MISELLNLADHLELETPMPFERRLVHFFIDLDLKGNVVGISPACGKSQKGKERLGKEFDCPVFFPLILDAKTGENVQATAGGGKSVAELASGDIMEIFRSKITVPKGKPPRIEEIKPSVDGEEEESTEDQANDDDSPDEDADEDSEDAADQTNENKKDQFVRRSNWVQLHKQLFTHLTAQQKLTVEHRALELFVETGGLLEPYLQYFRLPNPEKDTEAIVDPSERRKRQKEITQAAAKSLKQIASAKYAFRVNGKLMLKDPAVREWWGNEYRAKRLLVIAKLPFGDDMFTDSQSDRGENAGKLTTVFPHISGVPNGGPWCPLASFDKATSQSYGLGKVTAQMTLGTAERVAAALNHLLRNETTSYSLSKSVKAVFWALDTKKEKGVEDVGFTALMSRPDPLQVLDFLRNIRGRAATPPDSAQFYCALLSSPKARITIRSWHTETLGKVTEKTRAYFESVSLPDSKSGDLLTSKLDELAKATVRDSKKTPPQPSTFTALLNTALFGSLLPDRLLPQVIRRQCLELAQGKTEKNKKSYEPRLRSRTALIKLYFAINRKIIMNETTTNSDSRPAILCGRLLAILDKIHNEAHDNKSASSPANRLYGAASATPALIFPQLQKLARHHLNKIGGGWARRLEFGYNAEDSDKLVEPLEKDFESLAQITARLIEVADNNYPRILSLEDQGRFSIGFYYERCRKWPKTKDSAEKNKQ